MTFIFWCYNLHINYFYDYLLSIIKKAEFRLKLYSSPNNLLDQLSNGNQSVNIFVQKIPFSINHPLLQELNFVILNTEQISAVNPINFSIEYYPNVTYVDYSEENILGLNKINIKKVYHIPYQINMDEIYNFNKNFDVCIIGDYGDRRKKIINDLKQIGINVNVVCGWGQIRDKMVMKHKILLNIHAFSDFKIMEQIRINRCIFNKVIVVSESSENQDKLKLKDRFIISPFNKIVSKVQDILNNYDIYYDTLFSDFELEDYDRWATDKLNTFIQIYDDVKN